MAVIQVDHVSKVYKLYNKPSDRLRESLNPTRKSYHRDFYALNDISFKVEKAETVGIIGTNGSGKSTILKIITGLLNPSSGKASVEGKISALLELGAGFNPDYTGVENVYLNGTMMGYTKEQMDKKLPDILEFADIGDFVYQPVKTYSSGMFVRLAFAVAINVEPEVLIVDEALSVGDVFFQSKCYKRMQEIRKKGTTILMVTHDMSSIIKYCDRVVLLNNGVKVAEGKPGEMVDLYKKILVRQFNPEEEIADTVKEAKNCPADSPELSKEAVVQGGLWKKHLTLNPQVTEYGDKKAELVDFGLFDQKGEITNMLIKGDYFTIRERVYFHAPVHNPIFTYTFKDRKGTELTGTNTMYEGVDLEEVEAGAIYEISFRQKMTLQGGEYLLSMSCTGFEETDFVVHHRMYDIINVTVISDKNTVGVYDMESEVEVNLV